MCVSLSLCLSLIPRRRRVYKAAYEHADGRVEFVALKKIRMESEKEGVSFAVLLPARVLFFCLTAAIAPSSP